MPQLLADRFLASGSSWVDLASGAAVRVRLAPAGSRANQIAWNSCCAVLANLRHPLINPLVDYGMADARHVFEAYAMRGPIRATGASAAGLVDHVIKFLQANGVGLPRPLADYVLREVTVGHILPGRPVGVSLQPRQVFDAIHEALDAGGPLGACAMAISGEPHSGLRTLRMAAARTARLEGYVPIATSVLRQRTWLAATLLDRHVCVLAGEEPGEGSAVAEVLTRLGAASPRRHVVLSFGRTTPNRPAVQVERMGIVALMEMVFLDADYGPTPAELFDAARRSGGRPGQFLSCLGASEPAESRSLSMSVHESTGPYEVAVHTQGPAITLRAKRQAAGVLSRAPERSEALARAGRHAAAKRLLQRAIHVLSARGEGMHAARCAIRLGWLSIERAQLAAAVDSFDRARALSPDSRTGIRAGIGTGVAWTDEGRLADGEAALRAAMIAAQRLEDTTLSAQAVTWLARCLFWQGRYDEAAAVLRGVAETKISARDRACVLLTLARVHVAEEATATAVRTARLAVECATEAGEPPVLAAAFRILAHVVSAGGDPASAAHHLADGLRVARRAHLPLECARLRLTALEIQSRFGASPQVRLRGARLATASAPWPPLLRFHALAVRARVDDVELDAKIRGFIETSGAVALAHASGAPAANPVADLEALLDIVQSAADDHAALERVSEQLRTKLRAGVVIVIGPEPERRILALNGRPWHGDPQAAWRALATGLSVTADPLREPCQAAEPLRYGGEIIGAVSARWIAGSALDPIRAGALLRVGALALAASVRALLDRSLPAQAAHPCEEILGTSAAARSMQESIARAARAPFPVLIEGESGSGKELVARAIHRLGPRRDRRFCAINCAALSDDLLEAELFGHARGAFTGAIADRAGLFEDADGGTLFLDEIGELSARAQAKLLRVLQDGQVRRVGENTFRRVDVRIVAATNRRLAQEAAAGRFRADLRFRLDVVRIEVPALRERAGDVPLLATSFWTEAAARMGSRATLSPETLAALARYDWPGNVRELQNVIAWMAVHSPSRGRIPATAVPGHVAQATMTPGRTFESARSEFERRYIKAALAAAGGHRTRAAQALGITRQGLAKMLRRLALEGGCKAGDESAGRT